MTGWRCRRLSIRGRQAIAKMGDVGICARPGLRGATTRSDATPSALEGRASIKQDVPGARQARHRPGDGGNGRCGIRSSCAMVQQQLFAPEGEEQQIGGFLIPRRPPVKVLDRSVSTGGTSRSAASRRSTGQARPNLQATEISTRKTGSKRWCLLNPQTGEQTPIGGVAAADAPKETALDKQVAKERVDLASGAIQSAASARGMLPILDHLKQISDGDQGDLSRAIGGLKGYDWFQSSVGQIGGWGSPASMRRSRTYPLSLTRTSAASGSLARVGIRLRAPDGARCNRKPALCPQQR